MLVEDQIVEDAGEEDAFKHDQVTDDLACQESVLQLLVLNEVVQPLLAKSWHARHLEKVARFESRHSTARAPGRFCDGSRRRCGGLGASKRCGRFGTRAVRLLAIVCCTKLLVHHLLHI